MKFLAGVLLALMIVALGMHIEGEINERRESAYWWREAHANEFEWQTCEKKRELMLKAIRKEGLWNRLGMSGRPELQ